MTFPKLRLQRSGEIPSVDFCYGSISFTVRVLEMSGHGRGHIKPTARVAAMHLNDSIRVTYGSRVMKHGFSKRGTATTLVEGLLNRFGY